MQNSTTGVPPLPELQGRAEIAIFSLSDLPPGLAGRGVVVGVGGTRHFTNAWILVRLLRELRCQLPVQFWHLGETEISHEMRALVEPFGVECVDALQIALAAGVEPPGARQIKIFSILHSPFKEVLVLDANNAPVRNPECLFSLKPYRAAGALFWPLLQLANRKPHPCKVLKIPIGREVELDLGQVVIHKEQCWEALGLAQWLQTDRVMASLLRGKSAAFRLAWKKFGLPLLVAGFPEFLPSRPGCCATGILCQHDWEGERLFQHRTGHHWRFRGDNRWILGALFEPHSRKYLVELQSKWNGRVEHQPSIHPIPKWLFDEITNEAWIVDGARPGLFASIQGNPRTSSDYFEIPGRAAGSPGLSPAAKQAIPWQELRFHPDGTLGCYAGNELTFWDLLMEEDGPKLRVTSDKSPNSNIVLQREKAGTWHGHLRIGSEEHPIAIRAAKEVFPGALERCWQQTSAPAEGSGPRVTPSVCITNSALGLGENIASLYAAAAAASAGAEVTFYTRHVEWFSRIAHPRLTLSEKIPDDAELAIKNGTIIDLNRDAIAQIRYGVSKARWYAANIAAGLKPERPEFIDRQPTQQRFDFKDYVLLVPGNDRRLNWPAIHWQRLIALLKEASLEVVVIARHDNEPMIAELCHSSLAFWTIFESPQWMIDTILGARCVIANDYGAAQLGGLFQVPTVALHSDLPGEFLWDCTDVRGVGPQTECAFCRWSVDRHYNAACETGCSALASISPERVFRAVMHAD